MSLMTREQIKEHLQIGEFTLQKLMDTNAIPFLRINNKFIRFEPEKVTKALAEKFEGKAYVGKLPSPERIIAAKKNLKKGKRKAKAK